MYRPAFIPLILSLVCLMATPALPQEANLSATPIGKPGAVSQLIVAQRGYEMALDQNDPVLLLASIRLARAVILRPPTAWERKTEGEATANQSKGKPAAPDPGGDEAIALVRTLSGDDPDLQDLVYDLDAQLPQGSPYRAIIQNADLGVGQTDEWRMPLSGAVPTEIGLIGDGDGPLSLTIADEAGNTICAIPASANPNLCSFTPALNGFFTVTIRNAGTIQNSYRLLGN